MKLAAKDKEELGDDNDVGSDCYKQSFESNRFQSMDSLAVIVCMLITSVTVLSSLDAAITTSSLQIDPFDGCSLPNLWSDPPLFSGSTTLIPHKAQG